jgi:hypothetical protein
LVEATCHCGAVRIEINVAPQTVTDCNCSLCRRYGVLWAYYPLDQVRFSARGPTDIYMWDDQSLEFHRCAGCGCVTHWSAVDKGRDKMGVNARLLAPEVLAAARVRRLDGADTGAYLD